MTELHGFQLVHEREIAELNVQARLFRHIKTGAELISLECADENKAAGVAFKTPPPDDSGIPHILEHSVLSGSQKFPVRDPFIELLKTSVNTFLNAMTFEDFTIYPFASTNVQDLRNLAEVYFDAVFFPLIHENTLKTEGWHYELDAPDAPLTYKGVVFNEMKAYYSNPELLLNTLTGKALLPDTPYANDAGGDPSFIPDLTYQTFKQFHETHYHPSNARFFFYGDDDPQERLRFVDSIISKFERRTDSFDVPLQPRFDAPRTERHTYDAGEGGDRAFVTVNWLLSEVTNQNEMMALTVLEHALIQTPASPLRVALLDSGLGEDLTGGGFSRYTREASFGTGLKGVALENIDQVEQLIHETLAALVKDGIDPLTIEMALNTIEFHLREFNTGRFPRGLAIFIDMLPNWVHGGDAVEGLDFVARIHDVRAQYAANPRFFEDMIQRYFIENPHRVTLILEPDAQWSEKRAAQEQARLDAERAAMTDADIQRILQEAEVLKARQETPDRPEDLARIPTLKLSDLDRAAKPIPTEVGESRGATVLYHDLPTSNIIYLDLAFDLRVLPAEYVPYLPLFSKMLLEAGTTDEDYVALTQRIGSKTGGITSGVIVSSTADGADTVAALALRGKCLPHQADDLTAILADVLLKADWNARDRALQMVLEDKAEIETYIGMMGQAFAAARVNAALRVEGWVNEQTSGVTQLFFLRDIAKRIEQDWNSVADALRHIARLLVNRTVMTVNVTLDRATWDGFRPVLENLVTQIPAAGAVRHTWPLAEQSDAEALVVPAQVNFVGKAVDLKALGFQPSGAISTVLRTLNFGYMYPKIRLQGGAYGGAARYNAFSGVLTYLSWRDPNISGTLDTYDNAGRFLQTLELNDDELEKAVIGAVGELDQYQLPDLKGYTAMLRYLIGYTDAMRQQYRDEVFSTSMQDYHTVGEALNKAAEHGGKVVVVAGPQAAQKANESGANLTINKVI